MIKTEILRWGDYLGLSRWAQGNHKGRGGAQESQSREGDMTVEAEVGIMWKVPQTKECRLWKLEKARK